MDWNRVRELADAGHYAPDIFKALGLAGRNSNLMRDAARRGIVIPAMPDAEKRRRMSIACTGVPRTRKQPRRSKGPTLEARNAAAELRRMKALQIPAVSGPLLPAIRKLLRRR